MAGGVPESRGGGLKIEGGVRIDGGGCLKAGGSETAIGYPGGDTTVADFTGSDCHACLSLTRARTIRGRISRLRPVWRKLPSLRGKISRVRGFADFYQRFFR